MPPAEHIESGQHFHDIYAKLLFPLGHGHPLWMPDPVPNASAPVEIADVGCIEQGGFFQLFNATRREEALQIHRKVPEGFTPLHLPDLRIAGPHQRVMDRCMHSRTIKDFSMSGAVFLQRFFTVLPPKFQPNIFL